MLTKIRLSFAGYTYKTSDLERSGLKRPGDERSGLEGPGYERSVTFLLVFYFVVPTKHLSHSC